MTAGELRQRLVGVPDDTLVVMAKDAEGNGYSPLAVVVVDARYTADSTWSGECHHPDDFFRYPEAVPAVLLEPVN